MLKNVLIVDDSRVFHGAYMLFLKPYKCSFSHAMNGKEALELLSEKDDVDLILLDINMPVMNGLQFLENASSAGIAAKIPIVIVSTEGKEGDIIRGLQMGAKGYLKKPFQPAELHHLIDKMFMFANAHGT